MTADPTLPNDDNEEYPDPIPEAPRGEVGPSEAEWDFESLYNLTDIQVRAIELTVQGLADTQIAQMLSVNRKTLWKWKNLNDDYKAALANARSQVHATVVDRYRALLLKATTVLAKFLEDPVEDKRFRAALGLLNMAGCFRPLPTPADPRISGDATFAPPLLPSKVG
jgi:Putative ATPase subunit of terminase (gpP-like)